MAFCLTVQTPSKSILASFEARPAVGLAGPPAVRVREDNPGAHPSREREELHIF